MEKKSKDNKRTKKDKEEILVVQSEMQLTNAVMDKIPFQLGPSFTSIRIPFSYSVPDESGLIIKALKDNTTLKSITLGGNWNHPDVEVWKLDELEKSLIANTSIDTLIFDHFSFLDVHKKATKTLVKILTKNHRIQHVTFNSIDDNIDYAVFDLFRQNIHLFGLKSLKIVDLCSLHNIAIFNALPNSPTITSFHVTYAQQSPEVFGHMVNALMANPRITDLEIGTKTVIAGDRWLRFKPVLERDHLKRLTFVGINYSNHLPIQDEFDKVMSVLQNSKNLEELGFSFCNLNWKFWGDLLSNNKSVKKLVMEFASIEDFKVLKLDQNETITEVSFINWSLIDKGLPEMIGHNETIKKLHYETNYLKQDEFEGFLQTFKNNSTLTDVQFAADSSELPLGDLFAEALAVNTSIRRLKLGFHNYCGYKSACGFIDALKTNTTLNELSLDNVNLKDIGSQNKPPGAPTFDLLLKDLLKVNKSLTYFKGSEEFPKVDAALKRNLENQRNYIDNGKKFVKMLLMRPNTYGSIIPPEIWCMILRHVTAPGVNWNAEQFYRRHLP